MLFIDIAKNFANKGILGAPSYLGNGMNMANKTYFMPPVYPLLLGFWYIVFPQNLVYARILSNIFAAVALFSIFKLAVRIKENSIIPGVVILLLVVNPRFAVMYNWARPDILALMFSFAGIAIYFRYSGSRQKKNGYLFALSWFLATLGVLTHPVGGFIGFATIPLHMILSNLKSFKSPVIWLYFIFIPLFLITLWGIYIASDFESFKIQFIDWQLLRKAGRILDKYTLVKNILVNFGYNHQNKINLLISLVILGTFIIKAISAKSERHPALLIIIILLASGFIVESGDEMPYPPLRLPVYYLLILFCIEPPDLIIKKRKCFYIQDGIMQLNHSLIIIPMVVFMVFQSSIQSIKTIQEIYHSERATAYNYHTLSSMIIKSTEPGKQLGIRITPDCFDLLEQSGHFSSIQQLSWFELTDEALEKLVTKNDYLAITQSVIDPNFPGKIIDFTDPAWSNQVYDMIIEKHFCLKETLILPSGGKTLLFEKTSQPD
jgi:hypothetical protein